MAQRLPIPFPTFFDFDGCAVRRGNAHILRGHDKSGRTACATIS